MNYISVEKLKKQSEKVQKTLIESWKPQIGDLVASDAFGIGAISVETNVGYVLEFVKANIKKILPLLTESQLRKFAEEKTGCVFDITIEERNLEDTKWTYKFGAFKYNQEEGFERIKVYFVEAEDLLQAWWQLAIKIIEEE